MKESEFMQKCFELAIKGRLSVSPNPLVGAVVVKRNKIVGTGFHKVFGGEHAEVIALKKAGKKAKNAILFVNLEPCRHFGKQPPCTKTIIKAKIKEVVIGTKDLNPLVGGKGIRELKKNKIKVKSGVLEKDANKLNEKFLKFKKTKIPFVLIKNALSVNGKLSQKKISSKKSQKKVFELRSEFDSVLVGANTVIKDNPRLSARIKGGKNPLRIVIDSSARIPLNSKVLNDSNPTILVCTKRAKKSRIEKIIAKKRGVIVAKEKNKKVDLRDLLKQLGQMGISSVLVEGGAQITSSFLKENLFDKMLLIISPKDIETGEDIQKKLLRKLKIEKVGFIGEDVWMTLYPKKVGGKK